MERVRRGRSGAVVIVGDPGIGKTCLCDYARCQASDMLVLHTQGIESESQIPFAGVAQLLSPLRRYMRRLPELQRRAAGMALALQLVEPVPPFALGMAVLGLLTTAAEEGPLLLIVDDVHWLDPVSAQALGFAARRLDRDSVAILFALRPEEGHGFAGLDFRQLKLEGLAPDAAATMIAEVAGCPVPRDLAAQLWAATGGNPLALIETVKRLTEEVLTGRSALPDPLPLAADVAAMLRQRVNALPTATRQALAIVAADATGSLALIRPTLVALNLDLMDLEPAEALGIIGLDNHRVAFDHPLLRHAVYQGTAPAERRRAHQALATSAASLGDFEREAQHLTAAATGPDEALAGRLASLADRAAQIGGAVAAAPILEEAAKLAPAGPVCTRRLIAAAEALFLCGHVPSVDRYLDEAMRTATDHRDRAHAIRVLGQVMAARGETDEAVALVHGEARRLAVVDKEIAALMLCELAMPSVRNGDTARAVEIFMEAIELAPTGSVAALLANSYLAPIVHENSLGGRARIVCEGSR
jgi:AAA ATPase domain